MENVWDFVEKYYPNYSRCDLIAENDDYQKIVDGEINGVAEKLYEEEKSELRVYYGGTQSEEELHDKTVELFQQKLHESNAYVFEKAIEGYLETLKRNGQTF